MREIIRLVSEGYVDKQIADKLNMSQRGVRFNLQVMYEVTGVQCGEGSRVRLVVWAIKHGIIHV